MAENVVCSCPASCPQPSAMTRNCRSLHQLKTDLKRGIILADKNGRAITYRFIRPGDDIEAITGMLHDAYAPLAALGLRFVATHQDSAVTRRRMRRGDDSRARRGCDRRHHLAEGCRDHSGLPLYERPDVAAFGQYAVRPSHQCRGIGSTLLILSKPLA